ncbi:Ger(x)C family spore germination protein [Cytobacillus depressus]|uniref:Ger(X)C family spore germination protein n=1 Tax=Cytobacillus depressus TaxID=1602942 RepID=A0A6L3V1W8_9BACI|nr:Ger(x)C family spore germination protein [Cytobacillus depressus]KAB2330183.1 Ger(x)C family spore germination protein [Cytobacillus depressus]
MHKINSVIILSVLFLSGCWDQNLLKDASLINSIAFDLEDSGQVSTTVSIRSLQGSEGTGEQKIHTDTFTEVDSTPRGSRDKIDLEVAKKINASKIQVLLIGEKLAKKEFYPTLDVFYRDPKSALNAKLAVVNDQAKEVIKLGSEVNVSVGEYISDLLTSAEDLTMANDFDIQTVGTIILDPGRDIAIPMIHRVNHKTAKVVGLALFNNNVYSGMVLNKQDTTMYYLLAGHLSKIARFTKKIDDSGSVKDFITFEVTDLKRKLTVQAKKPQSVIVNINLVLKTKVVEYPKNKLDSQKEIDKLNKLLSKKMTEKAQNITVQLQEANCDALGIGRRMIALHPHVWKDLDWRKVYPTITFKTDVKVDITQKGITN